MEQESYFIVRCSDGETYKNNGMFQGNGQARPYKKLEFAKKAAMSIAKHNRQTIRVDNAVGETMVSFGPDGVEI